MADDRERIVRLEANQETIFQRLKHFVTLDRYQPVERIVYGIAALVLASVGAAVIKLVLAP